MQQSSLARQAIASPHVLERADLAFAVEPRPMDPMQLHELRRQSERLLARPGLDQRVAADDLFAFGERAVVTLILPRSSLTRWPSDVPLSPAVSMSFPLFKFAPTNSPIASRRPAGISLFR